MHGSIPTKILFVCTGNICRSPMAVACATAEAATRDLPIQVSSAGLLKGGNSPTREGIQAMAELGFDISGHRSTELDEGMLIEADLILGMARRHVALMVDLEPASWSKAFTLKEFVRRAVELGPRVADEQIASYVARCSAGRLRKELVSILSSGDDIEDPFSLGIATYRACAEEIGKAIEIALSHLFPPKP